MQTTLTRIFIVLESESHDLSENCDGISRKPRKFNCYYSPKAGGLRKKKTKRSSSKLSLIFWPKSEILTFFQPQNKWSPKKTKTSSSKLSLIFRPKSEILTFFQPKIRWSPKKKVFTEIESDFSAKIGNSNVLSGRITTYTSQLQHPISFGGGLFSIFNQKSASKAPKRAILHTSQANGWVVAPPPPWLRYWLL